jgi:hypothetical protein
VRHGEADAHESRDRPRMFSLDFPRDVSVAQDFSPYSQDGRPAVTEYQENRKTGR